MPNLEVVRAHFAESIVVIPLFVASESSVPQMVLDPTHRRGARERVGSAQRFDGASFSSDYRERQTFLQPESIEIIMGRAGRQLGVEISDYRRLTRLEYGSGRPHLVFGTAELPPDGGTDGVHLVKPEDIRNEAFNGKPTDAATLVAAQWLLNPTTSVNELPLMQTDKRS